MGRGRGSENEPIQPALTMLIFAYTTIGFFTFTTACVMTYATIASARALGQSLACMLSK
jgi:hypothetical protein